MVQMNNNWSMQLMILYFQHTCIVALDDFNKSCSTTTAGIISILSLKLLFLKLAIVKAKQKHIVNTRQTDAKCQ